MTRNREIDCEDLRGCDHSPEVPIINDDGIIDHWRCRCGRRAIVRHAELQDGGEL